MLLLTLLVLLVLQKLVLLLLMALLWLYSLYSLRAAMKEDYDYDHNAYNRDCATAGVIDVLHCNRNTASIVTLVQACAVTLCMCS
jgi:hypothetical protein